MLKVFRSFKVYFMCALFKYFKYAKSFKNGLFKVIIKTDFACSDTIKI